MYNERNPPEIWRKLGSFMHQDYFICHPDFNSGIEEFWQSVSGAERKELVEFLNHITSDELPGGMQKKYWHLSGAQIFPSKVKPFLNELFSAIKGLENAQ